MTVNIKDVLRDITMKKKVHLNSSTQHSEGKSDF